MPRILIVEDDLIILSNLAQLLKLSGLDVVEAFDGQEALRLLEEIRVEGTLMPKLIVSDLMMPNLDGFGLLRAVRAAPHLKSLPFVMLSARSDSCDLQQAFNLGASDYLIKPFEVERLIEVIGYHLACGTEQKVNRNTGSEDMVDAGFFLE